MKDDIAIFARLEELQKSCATMERLKDVSLEELGADREKSWAVFYGFLHAIQIVLDIGSSLLSQHGESDVEAYRDIITALGRRDILPKDFANDIQGMAGFRNVLVHEYMKIDLVQVHEMLGRLDDFRKFAAYVVAYMEKDGSGTETS